MEPNDYTNDALELLKALIATPSVSRNEDMAAHLLARYLERWGLPYGREGNNLWVGCPDWDNNRPTIMLNAHIDTVKPVSTWKRHPSLRYKKVTNSMVSEPTTVGADLYRCCRPIASCFTVRATTTSFG